MHVIACQQGIRLEPAIVVMLRIRQTQVCLIHLQAISEHHVVGGEIGAGKVVVIEVLPDAVELPRRHWQAQPQLRLRQTCKGIFQRLVFLHSSTRHEPVALRRTVGALPEQKLAPLVLHNQIDGDKRSGTHHSGKIFLT